MSVDESRRLSLTVATAGHVDHGKSLLVRNLTGTDTDTLAEEKSRGLSINLGFAYRSYQQDGNDCLLGFVDVPGHIDFIGNMLAGVGAVDATVLVVAADDGLMPQTEEHAAILHLLDIRAGCVALTKIDRVGKTRLPKVKTRIRELLVGTGLAECPIFPVSNPDGGGIGRLADYLHQLLLQKHRRGEAGVGRRFRFLIDRGFSARGVGTVVTGSCRAGAVAVGTTLRHSGGGETRIRGIRVHQENRHTLRQGERGALHITLDHSLVRRGDWLLDTAPSHPVNRFDVRLLLLPGAPVPKPNTRHHLHIGADHRLASLRRLATDAAPDVVKGDWFQVKTKEPLHVLHGDRFILRDPAASRTVGGGRVIDIFVPGRGRDSAARLDMLAAMDQPPEAACRELARLSPDGVDLNQFGICRNLTADRLRELADKLCRPPAPFVVLPVAGGESPRLMSREHYLARRGSILAAAAAFHRTHPERQGMDQSRLPQLLENRLPRLLLGALIERLVSDGDLRRSGSLLHLPGHSSRRGEEVDNLMRKLRPVLRKAARIPPRTRELAEISRTPLAALVKILRQAETSGELVKVADNRHYLPETLGELAALVEQCAGGAAGGKGFSVIEFRDASGIGRNLCIEILEYFDGIGFTRRDGNLRFLRPSRKLPHAKGNGLPR